MNFLSLGGGVQSSVMLLRALAGDIERPDHVLFADTGWELPATYATVTFLAQLCAQSGIPFHRVGAPPGITDSPAGWSSLPYFVQSRNTGATAMLRRQCTDKFKQRPLLAKQRELLGFAPRQRIPNGAAATSIGISIDEARRAVPSRHAWLDRLYPLIDPLRMSRSDCQRYWDAHYPDRPLHRSSCIGCPFHTDREWRHMQQNAPEQFEVACRADDYLRAVAFPGLSTVTGRVYLHRSLRPLRDVDFGQSQLGLDTELTCAGGCGL